MTNSGVPWDYRYQYMNLGWRSWNSPDAQFASMYAADSFSNGIVPVYVWYEIGTGAAGAPESAIFTPSGIQNPANMSPYYSDFVLLLQKIEHAGDWDASQHFGGGGAIDFSADNTVTSVTTVHAGQDSIVHSRSFHSTGKWAFRVINIGGGPLGIGLSDNTNSDAFIGNTTHSVGMFSGSGHVFLNNVQIAALPANFSSSAGDVVDVAVDLTGKLIWFRANGRNWNASPTANPTTGVGGISIVGITNALTPAVDMSVNGQFASASFISPFTLSGFASRNVPTKAIVEIEPDLWGYMQQNYGDDPTQVLVSVASSGFSGLSGFPNNAAGFAQALLALRNTYAPTVILAWHASMWGPNNGYDPTLSSPASYQTPQVTGGRVATFYKALNAPFDMIFHDPSDADSAYKVIMRGQAPSGNYGAWWTNSAFTSYLQYIGTVYQGTGLQSMLWQVPIGNTLYRSVIIQTTTTRIIVHNIF
jgi:hypothetical protein